ncbi:MAG TPA: class I SAM-dependent methyltransferase [Terriglobales bacterium]
MFWTGTAESDARGDRLDNVEMSQAAAFEASILEILNARLGFRKSLEDNICKLGDGRIIPMMSYGLIEYLMGIDLSGFRVLELGGGHSTEFWAQRAKSVLTLETDPEWAHILSANAFPNVEIRHRPADKIHLGMEQAGGPFDVIVIDVSASRYRCAKTALRLLNPGGFILLDNADWYPNTTALLRAADLIQVDFADFRPLRWYRCATSLFLHKDFRVRPRYERLPQPLIGGKDIANSNDWDRIE